MQLTPIAWQGVAGRRLMAQMAATLDPIAALHAGEPVVELTAVIEQAWYNSFRTQLREPTLSRCAAAIAQGRPWQLALWSND
jgi:hypothetical protein